LYKTLSPAGFDGGERNIAAEGINDNGEVVGLANMINQVPHGFFLSGSAYTFFDVTVEGAFPHGINAGGDIVGHVYENCCTQPSLGFQTNVADLAPVASAPEPATWALSLIAFLTSAWVWRIRT
jgi:probable HAF family extracellular repeat protein